MLSGFHEQYSALQFIAGQGFLENEIGQHSVRIPLKSARKSSYLCSCIHVAAKNRSLPIVRLPNVELEALQLYASYLESGSASLVLYNNSGPLLRAEHSLSWKECFSLVQAHILGTQFGDVGFQHHILNELGRWLKHYQECDTEVLDFLWLKDSNSVSDELLCFVIGRMFGIAAPKAQILVSWIKSQLREPFASVDSETEPAPAPHARETTFMTRYGEAYAAPVLEAQGSHENLAMPAPPALSLPLIHHKLLESLVEAGKRTPASPPASPRLHPALVRALQSNPHPSHIAVIPSFVPRPHSPKIQFALPPSHDRSRTPPCRLHSPLPTSFPPFRHKYPLKSPSDGIPFTWKSAGLSKIRSRSATSIRDARHVIQEATRPHSALISRRPVPPQGMDFLGMYPDGDVLKRAVSVNSRPRTPEKDERRTNW